MRILEKYRIFEVFRKINVEPLLFLLSFGDGILRLPVMDLVLSKTCLSGSSLFGEKIFSEDICSNLTSYPAEQAVVQATVSKFNSVSEVISGILTILVTIFLRSWCDSGVISLLFKYVHKELVIEYFWLDFLPYLWE